MAVVVLCSAGHSPGVSTTALGLALTWPNEVLLVDADRTPTQSVLAGYLRGERPGQRGFGRLLQAARERRPMAYGVSTAPRHAPQNRMSALAVIE